jgi:4-hydroxybenzoate polyprenyltransferase
MVPCFQLLVLLFGVFISCCCFCLLLAGYTPWRLVYLLVLLPAGAWWLTASEREQ